MLAINYRIGRLVLAAFLTLIYCHPAAAQTNGDLQPSAASLLDTPPAVKSSDSSHPALRTAEPATSYAPATRLQSRSR